MKTPSRLYPLFDHTSHRRQALAVLEERFSCSLRSRKNFIKAELVNAAQAFLEANASSSSSSSNDGERASSSVSDSPDEATASADHGSDQEGQKQYFDHDEERSESSSSSLSDDGGEQADTEMMPRPDARKTSARRTIAKAKVKRAIRRTKKAGSGSGGGSSDGRSSSGGDSSSSEKSSASSDSDLGSVASGGSGSGGIKGRRRKKPAQRKTTKKASSGDGSSSSSFSSGDNLSFDAVAEKANKKKEGKWKRLGKYTKSNEAAEKDGGSALVDSDEGGEQEGAASKGEVASTIAKAVVQEELDVRNM